MKTLLSTLIGCSIFLFMSCDKVKNPYGDKTNNNNNDTSETIKRNILIEEFTGQLCTFCPDGAREIERLIEVYGKQIIPVAIHAGNFAKPSNGAWNDFTTPAGDIYQTTFGVISYPAAMISRVNSGEITGKSQWESIIISIKDDEPLASIKIDITYNNSNRQTGIIVETEWLKPAQSGKNYKVQVYIVESNIIAKQIDNGVTVENYNHKHMLRADVNTPWGDLMTTSQVGEKETFSYNYTLSNDWKENDCEVVAFIYMEGPDYEVAQAAYKKIIP